MLRPPDSEPEPPEVRRSQHRLGGAQAVVASQSAAVFQAHGARRQLQLVVNHQHLLRLDLVEPGQLSDAVPGQVHVGLRLQEVDPVASEGVAGGVVPLEFLLPAQAASKGEAVGKEPGHIVSVPLVFLSIIPQKGYKTNHGSAVYHGTKEKGRGVRPVRLIPSWTQIPAARQWRWSQSVRTEKASAPADSAPVLP